MADLVIELVSEEIPARMQIGAGHDLARLVEVALTTLGVWNDDSVALPAFAHRGIFLPTLLILRCPSLTVLLRNVARGRMRLTPLWLVFEIIRC